MYMDIKKFTEEGYLQEANRQFFHPLGLALTIRAETDDVTGDVIGPVLAGIQDFRDDPEGMIFTEIDAEKAGKVLAAVKARGEPRRSALGYWIQPVLDQP
jgi:hypothetical protein